MEAFTSEEVIKLARGLASLRGATTPISIEHLLTDRGSALELLRPDVVVTEGVDLSTPVYAVLIRGSFPARPVAAQDSRHGEREIPATASILLIVEAATGQVVSSKATVPGVATLDLSLISRVATDAIEIMPLTNWSQADQRALQHPT